MRPLFAISSGMYNLLYELYGQVLSRFSYMSCVGSMQPGSIGGNIMFFCSDGVEQQYIITN